MRKSSWETSLINLCTGPEILSEFEHGPPSLKKKHASSSKAPKWKAGPCRVLNQQIAASFLSLPLFLRFSLSLSSILILSFLLYLLCFFFLSISLSVFLLFFSFLFSSLILSLPLFLVLSRFSFFSWSFHFFFPFICCLFYFLSFLLRCIFVCDYLFEIHGRKIIAPTRIIFSDMKKYLIKNHHFN